MKKLLVLGMILCGSASSAQFIVTGQNPSAGSTSSMTRDVYQPVTPQSPDAGLRGFDDITPTMRRQREARARLVAAAYPDLQAELAGRNPFRARYLYARAEKKALWAAINARDAAR